MSLLDRFRAGSPFKSIAEHARKVHECVGLLRPLTEALLTGKYDELQELHHQMSKTEHEADMIKDEVRRLLAKSMLLSVKRYEVKRFVGLQDDIADAAEDYAVVLTLRNTKVPEELHEDLRGLVEQVLKVSDHFLSLSENLVILVESGFSGEAAEQVLKAVEDIGEQEWNVDKAQRRFARHFYELEDRIDPVTLSFLDKYCQILGLVANRAEKTSKYLRQLVQT